VEAQVNEENESDCPLRFGTFFSTMEPIP
jgi:hypothetical protein